MAETKHEFIDDNPYITYTGKPETAYDGEGGGGGGGGGSTPTPFILDTDDAVFDSDTSTYTWNNLTYGDFIDAIDNSNDAIFILREDDEFSSFVANYYIDNSKLTHNNYEGAEFAYAFESSFGLGSYTFSDNSETSLDDLRSKKIVLLI